MNTGVGIFPVPPSPRPMSPAVGQNVAAGRKFGPYRSVAGLRDGGAMGGEEGGGEMRGRPDSDVLPGKSVLGWRET